MFFPEDPEEAFQKLRSGFSVLSSQDVEQRMQEVAAISWHPENIELPGQVPC